MRIFELSSYNLIPIVAALITFGQVIFPRIPFAVGGGQPRPAVIEKFDGKTFGKGNIYILGESSQFLFLVDINKKSSQAFQLNKDEVQSIQTLEKTN